MELLSCEVGTESVIEEVVDGFTRSIERSKRANGKTVSRDD